MEEVEEEEGYLTRKRMKLVNMDTTVIAYWYVTVLFKLTRIVRTHCCSLRTAG